MKCKNQSNKKPKIRLPLGTICGVAGIIGIASIAATSSISASALSYSTSSDVSFTFAPTLSIGLSTDSLNIDNLVPGNTSDSNSVKVTVSSNTPYGYVLSASVGSSDSTSAYYNTSNLVHEDSTVNNAFTSIDTSANLTNLTTDNTWGYSTSLDNGTTWSTYSGLSSATAKPLLDISDPAQPSTIDFKIAAKSSTTQASGTYNNIITFYAVGKPKPLTLYEEVAKMSKGTQTEVQLQASSSTPTSTDYREDTSTSGVYEYNSAIFGESSDANNNNKIYYYRGKLEPDYLQYGSSGNATTYPNYVKLDNDTCWRIVRTTGSGGVKIIYSGVWNGSTCVVQQLETGSSSSSFNGTKNTTKQIVLVGYTYNSNYARNSTTSVTLANLFGTNSYNRNTTDSTIKTATENWYAANLTGYNNILEPSAGYCSDRTVYDSGVLQNDSFSTQYISIDTGQYLLSFGSAYSDYKLGCPRDKVDLYTTPSAENGNKQLKYPIAHLTKNEAYLAGLDGWYNNMKWLGTSYYWKLLSPSGRITSVTEAGNAQTYYVLAENRVVGKPVYNGFGTRPVISLRAGIVAESGSGTATDPWVVPAP